MENNKMEVFRNEMFGEVRTILKDGEPWFVAMDVCKALKIANGRDATNRLDDDEKAAVGLTDISSSGTSQKRDFTIINEPGLYSLVLSSRKSEAKTFKRWITHEVIPSIRKHGAYMTETTLENCLNNPDFAIGLLTALKDERAKSAALEATVTAQTKQIEEMKPKASYYDVIINCKNAVAISKISKDYGMSAKTMNLKLHDLGIQYKQGDMWLLYQKYADLGYTQSKTFATDVSNSHMHTYWTQKGRVFLYELLKENGIVPTIERGD